MTRARELVVLLGGRKIGVVQRVRGDRLRFVYEEAWRENRGAMPLSLSMPLASAEHGHARIEAFLWNLLPDNELILSRWARRFQVSSRNVFSLMAHVGEDCPGAVQLVPPERLAQSSTWRDSLVHWLDETDVAERLRALQQDPSAWRTVRDTGHFSLAGAQPKTALLYQHRRWGVPSGAVPTTHILKPPLPEFDGHSENEHACLQLARAIGLPTATTEVCRFRDEVAIVIERFDRLRTSEAILRVHQEDMYQALGRMPTSKYQNEGGPAPRDVVELLGAYSDEPDEDARAFVDSLVFNWLIGGTDAHAKNYALLHGRGSRVRLAPLYDIASVLAYPRMQVSKLKLAMKIGDRYRLRDIGPRQWEKLALELGREPRELLERVVELGEHVRTQIEPVCREAKDQGLTHPVIDRLERAVGERAQKCARRITQYLQA